MMEPESSQGSTVRDQGQWLHVCMEGRKFHYEVGQMLELMGNVHPWQRSKLPWMRSGAAKLLL